MHTGPDLIGFCSRKCFQHSLFLVIFQDQFCLVLVNLHSLDKCFWFIIHTLNERLSSHIIHVDCFGTVKFEVVAAATGWMNPASREALPDDLKGHVQVHHQVYLINSIQGFSLCECLGETTQQPVILGEIFRSWRISRVMRSSGMNFPWDMKMLASTPISVSLSMLSRSTSPLENFFSWKCLMMRSASVLLLEPGVPMIMERAGTALTLPWLLSEARAKPTTGLLVGSQLRLRARSQSRRPDVGGGATKKRRGREGVTHVETDGRYGRRAYAWVLRLSQGILPRCSVKGGRDGRYERKMKQSVDSKVPPFTGGKGEEGGIHYLKRLLKTRISGIKERYKSRNYTAEQFRTSRSKCWQRCK